MHRNRASPGGVGEPHDEYESEFRARLSRPSAPVRRNHIEHGMWIPNARFFSANELSPRISVGKARETPLQDLEVLLDEVESAYLTARREVFDLSHPGRSAEMEFLTERQQSVLERLSAAESAVKIFRQRGWRSQE